MVRLDRGYLSRVDQIPTSGISAVQGSSTGDDDLSRKFCLQVYETCHGQSFSCPQYFPYTVRSGAPAPRRLTLFISFFGGGTPGLGHQCSDRATSNQADVPSGSDCVGLSA